jgi:hypothetical protein
MPDLGIPLQMVAWASDSISTDLFVWHHMHQMTATLYKILNWCVHPLWTTCRVWVNTLLEKSVPKVFFGCPQDTPFRFQV